MRGDGRRIVCWTVCVGVTAARLPPRADPHLYRDARGHCHAVFHALDHWADTNRSRMRATVGGHAYSRDCEHFAFSPEYAFSATVEFEGGGRVEFSRRERPEVIQDARGR